MLERFTWLGHDCFRIDDGKIIYFDPYKLSTGLPPADLVLITHEHFDHLSEEDIAKVSKPDTAYVAPENARGKLKGSVTYVKPRDTVEVKGYKIEVVPAYNVDKFRAPGQVFHPKEYGGVGYVITLSDGTRVYHAGDTDFVPEMKSVQADVALLPVSGTYVMTADEAAEAAKAIGPKMAVPMHFGAIVGSEKDAQRFKDLAGVPVQILPRSQK
ncbi:MAG: MBL fold metallo-hydrolase [Armatimonadota bacterium]